jgi:hypothetical protein
MFSDFLGMLFAYLKTKAPNCNLTCFYAFLNLFTGVELKPR